MIVPVRKTGSHDEVPDIIKACFNGNTAEVIRLLEEGVNVNTVDPRDNLTPLHIACLQGHEYLVRVILEHHRIHGDVDFAILSHHRPRVAWQYAANGGFWLIAELVNNASLGKPIEVWKTNAPS